MLICYKIKSYLKRIGSFDSGEETPSNISNLEVKLTCGEGSARETVCETSKKLPLIYKKANFRVGFFFGFFLRK